jgi:hypothetical protein
LIRPRAVEKTGTLTETLREEIKVAQAMIETTWRST